MASSKSGVDSASCGFANNPFLQKMGKKKIIARHRSATVPDLRKSSNKTEHNAVIKAPTKPPNTKPALNVKNANEKIQSENKKKSSAVATKPVSKVAALSASLSSEGISYGQRRPATKAKPFKSADPHSNTLNTTAFDRPSIKKRRPKTKKHVMDIDSESEHETKNKDQIIEELKEEIAQLKTKQTEENQIKYKQLNDENTALKQEINKIRHEYNQQMEQLKCENVSLQNQMVELNKNIFKLQQEKRNVSPQTDDDIVIVDKEQDTAPTHETLGIKSEETLNDAMDLRIDSNYKMINAQHETDIMHEDEIDDEQQTNVTSKGLFDAVPVMEEAGLFGDKSLFETDETPKQERKHMLFENPLSEHVQNTKENVVQSQSVNEENDPLMTENKKLFEEILNEKESENKGPKIEKDVKKVRKVKDMFDEDEDVNDLFTFVSTNNNKREAIQEKKQRLSSLFDSDDDDDDDDLFNINKEVDEEDTINID